MNIFAIFGLKNWRLNADFGWYKDENLKLVSIDLLESADGAFYLLNVQVLRLILCVWIDWEVNL